MARTTAHNAEDATYHVAYASRVSVSQKTRRAKAATVKINFATLLLSKPCNFRLSGVPNNPCDSTGMLNIDEGVAHVDNKSKILQKSSILQIQNVRFIPASLSGKARSASNTRPAFYLPQNVRPTFCQL